MQRQDHSAELLDRQMHADDYWHTDCVDDASAGDW